MSKKTTFLSVTLVVALGVVLLDRWSKTWVMNNMPLYSEWLPLPSLYPYFRFLHSTNTGIAFGLFQGGTFLFTLIPSIAVVAILAYSWHHGEESLLLAVSLGMMLGGAIGNLWDRLAYGAVVDFISVRVSDSLVWPTFNLADTFVVIGTGLLILYFLMEDRRARQEASTPDLADERP